MDLSIPKGIIKTLDKKSEPCVVFSALVETMLFFRSAGPWKGISFEASVFRLEFTTPHEMVPHVAEMLNKLARQADRKIIWTMTTAFSHTEVCIRWYQEGV